MNGGFWQGFWTAVPTLVLALIGYLSLRYKASADNVAFLEKTVSDLKNRVVELEVNFQKCQEERHKLVEDKIKVAEELAETKLKLTAHRVSEKLAAEVSAKVIEQDVSQNITQSIKENTELTAQTAQAVQSLAETVDKIAATQPQPVRVVADDPIPVVDKSRKE